MAYKGPFIFYEVGGGGWWDLRGGHEKNMALKGGLAKKIWSVRGVTENNYTFKYRKNAQNNIPEVLYYVCTKRHFKHDPTAIWIQMQSTQLLTNGIHDKQSRQ